MSTNASRSAARVMMAPAVILLLGWMLVPLTMTFWFSSRRISEVPFSDVNGSKPSA
ncbi:hypothetical protein N8Z34_02875 [Oceanospirillaceae bacterium]|nr:hypothetical protein [Oceanospirillaceae bacterium]